MSVRPEVEMIRAALERIEAKVDAIIAATESFETAAKPARRTTAK